MYVSMKEVLQHAHENNYAVVAVSCINMEMVNAAIDAAEEERSAVIINLGPGHMKRHAHCELMMPMVRSLAQKAKIPVAFNLDHGQDLDVIVSAIQNGFSSVMIDASSYEFEENVKRTKTIVSLAHPQNVCVEGELGHVGMAANGDGISDDMYTDPMQAKEFVERTKVDALAVAIGTAHGKYPAGFVPKLDFERLKLLKSTLNMPLVLHGGSGASEDSIREAVKYGINKINVGTDMFKIAQEAMAKKLEKKPNADYVDLCEAAEEAVKNYTKHYMRLIGSSNRYFYGTAVIDSKE